MQSPLVRRSSAILVVIYWFIALCTISVKVTTSEDSWKPIPSDWRAFDCHGFRQLILAIMSNNDKYPKYSTYL